MSQTKVHLSRLTELEYFLVHRSVPGRPHVCELLYQGEGDDGRSFLPGLLDPTELDYDGKRPGPDTDRPARNGGRPGVAGPWPGPSRGGAELPK